MTESEAIKICNTIVFATSFSNPQGIPLNTTKDELAPDRGNMNTEIFPDCGIMCYLSLN